tara:strand:+ start:412 stop:1479 length:1068 start_codon:yes stop_codon:yes gene_type:complete
MRRNKKIKVFGDKFKKERHKYNITQVHFEEASKKMDSFISRRNLQSLENNNEATYKTLTTAVDVLQRLAAKKSKNPTEIKSIKDLIGRRELKKLNKKGNSEPYEKKGDYNLENIFLSPISNLLDIINIKKNGNSIHPSMLPAIRIPDNQMDCWKEANKFILQIRKIEDDNTYSIREEIFQSLLNDLAKGNIELYGGNIFISEIDLELKKTNQVVHNDGVDYNDLIISGCNAKLKKEVYSIFVFAKKNINLFHCQYKNYYPDMHLNQIIDDFNQGEINRILSGEKYEEEYQIDQEDDIYAYLEEEFNYVPGFIKSNLKFPEKKIDEVISHLMKKYPKEFNKRISYEAQLLKLTGAI